MIHLHRHGAAAVLRPIGRRRWALQTEAGEVRTVLGGTAGQVRREAKRIIDRDPSAFSDQPNQQGGQQ
jgi:hypothetical protein